MIYFLTNIYLFCTFMRELCFQLFTDAIFSHCIINMTNRLSSPVYTYLYDYQNDFSYNKVYGTCKKPLGVTHGDENISLFKMVSLYPNDLNANDLEVSQLLTKTWYKFATSKYVRAYRFSIMQKHFFFFSSTIFLYYDNVL